MSNKSFEGYQTGLDSPADTHASITAGVGASYAGTKSDPFPRSVRCDTDGTILITDKDGTEVTYNCLAGEIIPVRPKSINASSTANVQVFW